MGNFSLRFRGGRLFRCNSGVRSVALPCVLRLGALVAALGGRGSGRIGTVCDGGGSGVGGGICDRILTAARLRRLGIGAYLRTYLSHLNGSYGDLLDDRYVSVLVGNGD